MSIELETLLINLGVAFILLNIPIIGKYVAIMHTLIHEIGHAVMALITGGRVKNIKLFANTEGEAWTQHHRIGRILTAIAGYPFASAVSIGLLYLLNLNQYMSILFILTGFVAVGFLFWIRNIYGFLWTLSFGMISYLLYTTSNEQVIALFATFMVSIIFIEAIQKAFVILILSLKKPMHAGDASILMKSTLLIPSQVWGVLFFGQALLLAYRGLSWFL